MNPSDGKPEIPPILDSEHARLMQPMKPVGTALDLGGILVDDQLFAQATMAEVHVYMHLVRLAREARTGLAMMPPVRDFSREIGIDERRVRSALHKLHELGWIVVTNLTGRRERFRVIVKEKVKRIVDEMNLTELIEREVRKRMRQVSVVGHNLQDDIIYNPSSASKSDNNVVNQNLPKASLEGNSPFPPQICELIAAIPHLDKRGKRLSSYPHSVIHAKAHHASIPDIESGLVNLFSYEPSAKHGGKIGSIIATWSAMFAVDSEGKGILKMRKAPKDARTPWNTGDVVLSRDDEFQRAVRALIDRMPVYVGHLDLATLRRARQVDALMKCPADEKMEQLRETCYAELDDEGRLQFHHYTREEIERGNLALESLRESLTSPTQAKRPGPASQ